jgi:hypothetical protein
MKTIYYQYELNEEGLVIAIHSSDKPFKERQIPQDKVHLIKLGKPYGFLE